MEGWSRHVQSRRRGHQNPTLRHRAIRRAGQTGCAAASARSDAAVRSRPAPCNTRTIAATYDEYKQLDLSFTQDAEKRAERLRQILKVDGPLKKYADVLSKPLDEVMSFAELRNFCAHGLLVRPADFGLQSKMHYRMFRMYKGGELKEEMLDLTIKEYTEKEKALMAATKQFMQATRKIWQELKLPALDDPTATAS
jgi:hypothetical protein